MKCKSCEYPLKRFLDLGMQPIANRFRKPGDSSKEYFFSLEVANCEECSLIQLVNQPSPVEMFNSNYPFFTSQSMKMKNHFEQTGAFFNKEYLGVKPFIVELGCNDGCFLEYFKKEKIQHLGVEPSSNVATVAKEKGINIHDGFFTPKLAREIVEETGPASLIYAANVMCHLEKIDEIAKGVSILLRKDGRLIFEDPYWCDILKLGSYDQIYDEHAHYFTATSVQRIFKKYNLELVKVEHLKTHGGSARYTIANENEFPVCNSVKLTLESEIEMNSEKKLIEFSEKIEQNKKSFKALLQKLKSEGKRVAGYGATSKSTTVLNYCGINSSLIEFITDTTPEKQHKLTPGSHIPIVPREYLDSQEIDYLVLFAWNHKDEIIQKESNLKVKWITYFPEVSVF